MANTSTLPLEAGAKEMQLVPQSESQLQMIERMASSKDVDVDKFERFLQMRDREQSRAAELAFNVAMSAAQTDMRPIAADAENPQTRSRYASYAALDRGLRPIYTRHGFALSFDTGDGAPADCLRALCYVTHVAGHARTYKIDMPADGKGAKGGDVMTKTHAAGSAMSYGMRYLLKMIFNVAVGAEDDDGNAAGKQSERADVEAPEGFENWFLDMEALVFGGCTWAQFAKAWNPPAIEAFRNHLARTNNAKILQWKKTARGGKDA